MLGINGIDVFPIGMLKTKSFFLAWHGAVIETLVFLYVFEFSGNLKSSQKVAKLVLTRTGCIIRLTWCDAWDQWNRCISNWNVKNHFVFLAWHGAVIETMVFSVFLNFQVT